MINSSKNEIVQSDPRTERFQRLGIVALAILLFGFGVTSLSPGGGGQLVSTTLYNALFSGASLILLGMAVTRHLGPRLPVYTVAIVIFALVLDAASTLAIFLVTNSPFLLATPEEWISGVLAFSLIPPPSMGIGLSPFGSNLAPDIPHSAYTFLSLVAYVALGLWYAMQKKPNVTFAWIIPLFPFWFAWRSLSNYFSLSPLLGLAVASDSWPDTEESRRGPDHHKGSSKDALQPR